MQIKRKIQKLKLF